MRYKNKKTNAIIETDLVISGGDWEVLEEKKKAAPRKKQPKKEQDDA